MCTLDWVENLFPSTREDPPIKLVTSQLQFEKKGGEWEGEGGVASGESGLFERENFPLMMVSLL